MEIHLSNKEEDRFHSQHKLAQPDVTIKHSKNCQYFSQNSYPPCFSNIPHTSVQFGQMLLSKSQDQLISKQHQQIQIKQMSTSNQDPSSKNEIQSTVLPQSLKIQSIAKNNKENHLTKVINPLDLLKNLPSFNFNLSQRVRKQQYQDLSESQPQYQEDSSQEAQQKRREKIKNMKVFSQELKKYKELLSNYYGQYKQKHLIQKKIEDISKQFLKKQSNANTDKRLFFNTPRFKFKKLTNKKQAIQSKGNKYIFKYLKASNRIIRYPVVINHKYEQQLIEQQCIFTFKNTLNISPYIEYDQKNNRIICYENKKGEIIIISNKNCQVLCKIKVQQKRYNPLLYVYQRFEETVLLIVGGFTWKKSQTYKKMIAEGSKFIQVFIFDKWSVNLKHKTFKMKHGRCYPLLLVALGRNSLTSNFQNMLYIFGGNSLGALKQSFGIFRQKNYQDQLFNFQKPIQIGDLNFNQFKDFNSSINQTGLLISFEDLLKQVKDSIDTRSLSIFRKDLPYEMDFLSLNINVVSEQIQFLYSGKVLRRPVDGDDNEQIFLSLPGISTLFLIFHQNQHLKIIKTQCKLQNFESIKGIKYGIENLSMVLIDKNTSSYCYYIDNNGKRVKLKIEIIPSNKSSCLTSNFCQIM